MTQTLTDFHTRCKERAEELANRLGVEFKPIDIDEVENKAIRRMNAIQLYLERKDDYDELLEKVFSVVSPSEVVEFIKNTRTK